MRNPTYLFDASSIIKALREARQEMIILEPRGLEQDILRIAVSKGVTVYDASYIAIAAKHGLTLVTEDQKLSRVARNVVNVVSLNYIINTLLIPNAGDVQHI